MVGIVAISDIEDGCEYAKELSKCLELDLEWLSLVFSKHIGVFRYYYSYIY